MSSELKTLSDRSIKIFLWVVTFGFIALMGVRLNITVVVDEPGTIANIAWLAGNDWNTCIQGIGGFYYKYGTALFYYPLYLIFQDSYVFYSAVMLLHSAFLGLIPVIAYDILRNYLKTDSKLLTAIISETLGIFPMTILYSLYARADAMLIFLPWLVCFLLLKTFEVCDKQEKKRWIVYTFLLSFAAFYGYACHTRGIVFVIAVFCTVFAGEFFCKIKIVHWPTYIISNILFYLCDKQISHYFKNSIWYNITNMHASAETFKFEKLKAIYTTLFGFKSFVKLNLGWVFNALTSTYGLITIGVIFSIIVIFFALRKKTRATYTAEEKIVAAFGLLNFFGTCLLGTLFFYIPAARVFTGKLHKRLDRLIYGRYMACALGVIVLFALYVLIFKSDRIKWKTKAASLIMHIGVVAVFFGVIVKYVLDGSVATRYIMELTTFMKFPERGRTTLDSDWLLPALIAAAVLGLLLTIFIYIMSAYGRKQKLILCTVVLFVTGIITYVNYYNIRLGKDDLMVKRITTVKDMVESMDDLYEEYPVICIDEGASTIGTYQLPLRNYMLVTVGNQIALKTDNMMIISETDKISDIFLEGDVYYFEDMHYETENDVLYIKGEELKNKLTEMGYHLKKY